ncbi:MAG TPA: TerC family protein [Parvularculaceae bacterium]|nr:TerC family protein [Parvularculaceae bacterium]
MGFLNAEWLAPFFQVVIIDLTLAGDNAVVIGLAAAGLPARQRMRAIVIGIIAATVLRICFSVATAKLMNIVGLILAGGILLLWVSWKLWRELHATHADERRGGAGAAAPREKSLFEAVIQIIIADISMSLDNVLAVAGAAREHPAVLVFGLTLSVLLMGFAAALIARLLKRHRWVGYVGLAIIVFVAADMIYEGARDIMETDSIRSGLAAFAS